MIVSTKQSIRASICRDSFEEFVKTFWSTVVPETMEWNWHLSVLCKELQMVAKRVFDNEPKKYDLVINISPGSTKSTICSIMFPAWVWCCMPSCRTICGSYAYSLAMELSRKSRMVVMSELYQETFGELKMSEDQNTKGHFANTAGGGRICVGTGGSITGNHAHFLIIDDPLDPLAASSEAELRTANTWMKETLPTRMVDKRVTPMILIMQRLHQNDPTGAILTNPKKKAKTRLVCLPAEASDKVRPRYLKKKYINGLMDPSRLSRTVLDDARTNLGEYAYAGQFGQDPIPRGGGMIKTGRITIDEPPVRRKFKKLVRYWDKAGTGGGGCFTVGVLMGLDYEGRFWIIDVVRGQWDASEREKMIKSVAVIDGKGVKIGIEQEPGSGGKESAQNTVKNLAGWSVYVDRPVGNKELRIDPFATQSNSGNVYMKLADWNADYIDELTYFPLSTYKDQADATSGAFAMLSGTKVVVGGWPGRN